MNESEKDCDCGKRRGLQPEGDQTLDNRVKRLPDMLLALREEESASAALVGETTAIASKSSPVSRDTLQELVQLARKERVRIIIEPME